MKHCKSQQLLINITAQIPLPCSAIQKTNLHKSCHSSILPMVINKHIAKISVHCSSDIESHRDIKEILAAKVECFLLIQHFLSKIITKENVKFISRHLFCLVKRQTAPVPFLPLDHCLNTCICTKEELQPQKQSKKQSLFNSLIKEAILETLKSELDLYHHMQITDNFQ